jgi:hypothetical protein
MSQKALEREVERLQFLRPDVQHELRTRFPSVLGVGVGARKRRGALTGEIAFTVYVGHKISRGWLPAAQILPRSIEGYPIDVQTIMRAGAQCKGGEQPLIAGVVINTDPANTGSQEGTIGCFVRVPQDNHFGGLTCEHVLHTQSIDQPNGVYQPRIKRSILGGSCNQIGTFARGSGFRQVVAFNGQPNYVDCAVVDLKGITFVNKLKALAASGGTKVVTVPAGVVGAVKTNDQDQVSEIRDGNGTLIDTTLISGSAAAQPMSLVWKVGGETKLTVGVITAVNAQAVLGDGPLATIVDNQILVAPLAGFRTTTTDPDTGTPKTVEVFSMQGDSGSAYMNLQNKVVGLHHHGSPSGGVGTNIDVVLSKLGGATVLTETDGVAHPTAAESTVLARSLWSEVPPATDFDAVEQKLRARLSESRCGAAVLALMKEHLPEILALVWQRRAVTVAWHRHHGPAFVALFARALATETKPFPTHAGAVARRATLRAMADVLVAQGSGALSNALAEARPWLLDVLSECVDLNDLCARLARVDA